ncbi:MAG: hypothetical protein GY740_09310, partial [Gammaproteobacteria bacterium]|nr:hypothetical protein [Gammaproteobacteria bacterium]
MEESHPDDLPSDEDPEEEDDEEGATDEEEEQEEAEEEEEQQGTEGAIWQEILERVYEKMDFAGNQTADEVLATKKYRKEVISALREETEAIARLGNFLQNESDVYEKLRKTKDKLMAEEDYEEEEATLAAWKNRKHLLTEILEEHKDVLAEHLDN